MPAESLTANKTITALLLAGGTVGEAGFTLTLSSGGLVGTQAFSTTNSNTIIGGTLAFGTSEGILTSTGGAIITLNSTITGSGGLTLAGTGVVNLPNANTYTGGTVLGGSTLNLGSNNSLGTGTVTLVAGTIQALAAVTINNAVTFNNSSVTIAGSNNLTLSGPITLADTGTAACTFSNTLTVNNSAETVLCGQISGSGALFLAGSGNVFLTGNNTYTGATFLTGNLITVAGSNTAFGTGTLVLTTGTLLADSAGSTLANNFVLNGSGFIFGASSYNGTTSGSTNNSTLTFIGAGALDNVAAFITTVVYNTTTFSNTVSGPGGLLVAGPGNLILSGVNTYAGGTVLNSSGTGVVAAQYTTSTTSTVTGINFTTLTPAFTHLDPTINYPAAAGFIPPAGFGNPPPVPPGLSITGDALTETGYLNIVTPGNYIFQFVGDDGAVVYVDGIIVDNGDSTNLTTTSIAIPLSAGLHAIQVRVNNNGGNAAAVLSYQGPDTNNVLVLVPFGALSNPLGTAGSLQITNNGSLGTGPVELSNGVLQANAAVTLTNFLSLSGGPLPLTLAGSNITIANPAALTGNVSLSVNNTTTFGSDLAGTSSLTTTNQPVVAGTTTYTGTGNLVFSAPVTYSGSTIINAGTVTLSGNGALTQTANTNNVQTISLTKVASGTFTLTFNGQTTAGITYSTTPATTASAIQTALGALTNIGSSNVSVTALSSSGANSQLFQVTFLGTLASTPQPLMAISTSGLTASANIVLGTVSTTTTGSAGVVIGPAGTLTLDNTAINNTNRINDAATVAFNGGILNFLGANGAASTETFGTTFYSAGSSTIVSTAGTGAGSSVTLIANVVGRNAGATANLVAGGGQTLGSATNQFLINLPASALLNNGIVKGFTVTDAAIGGFNFATATGTSTASISALPLAGYTALSATGGNTATQNVLVDASQTGFGAPTGAIASDSVNALLIRGDGVNISGAPGAVLTVGGASGTAGMLVTSGGTSIGNTISIPTLALGTQEGVFIANNGTTTVNSTVTGTGGLTLSGSGNLNLANANNLTGTETLNSGTLTLANSSTVQPHAERRHASGQHSADAGGVGYPQRRSDHRWQQ